jgi:lipoprotein NlpD
VPSAARAPASGPRGFALALLAALLAACAQSGAPVVDKPVYDGAPPAAGRSAPPPAGAAADWRPEVYTVKGGDTLYSIALEHGQSYRDVAAWNAIADPNIIQVGQQLRMRPPPGWVEPPEPESPPLTQALAPPEKLVPQPLEAPPPPPVKSAPKALKTAYSEQALATMRGIPYPATATTTAKAPSPATPPAAKATPAAAKPAAAGTPAPAAATAPSPTAQVAKAAPAAGASRGWVWPARGRLLHVFDQGANPKGIAIAGEAGQPVVAAAAGKVVYSGSGLRGYGKLIIIKHDDTYLSVYAHNRALLVKEGERVNGGQRIAEMGSTDADRVRLHFEIRRLGKPVDPLQFLPPPGA